MIKKLYFGVAIVLAFIGVSFFAGQVFNRFENVDMTQLRFALTYWKSSLVWVLCWGIGYIMIQYHENFLPKLEKLWKK